MSVLWYIVTICKVKFIILNKKWLKKFILHSVLVTGRTNWWLLLFATSLLYIPFNATTISLQIITRRDFLSSYSGNIYYKINSYFVYFSLISRYSFLLPVVILIIDQVNHFAFGNTDLSLEVCLKEEPKTAVSKEHNNIVKHASYNSSWTPWPV